MTHDQADYREYKPHDGCKTGKNKRFITNVIFDHNEADNIMVRVRYIK
jgi:hypothetical protein